MDTDLSVEIWMTNFSRKLSCIRAHAFSTLRTVSTTRDIDIEVFKYSLLTKMFDEIVNANSYEEVIAKRNVFVNEVIVQLKRALLLAFFTRGDIYESVYNTLHREFKGRETLDKIIPIITGWYDGIKANTPDSEHYKATLIIGFCRYVEMDPKLFKHPFDVDVANGIMRYLSSLLKEHGITKKNYNEFQKMYMRFRGMEHHKQASFDFFRTTLLPKFEEIVYEIDEDLR